MILWTRPTIRRLAIALAVIGCFLAPVQIALADTFVVRIPDEGWSITLDAPVMTETQSLVTTNDFKFEGHNSHGFNVTISVERIPQGQTVSHTAVFNQWWPQTKRNPLIHQGSVKVAEGEKGVKVTYLAHVKGELATNVNYYFAFRGRWVEIHISKQPIEKYDERLFEVFDSGLSYGSVTPGPRH